LAIVGSLFGSQPMFLLGTLAYIGSVLFHFVTLPVEFDASRLLSRRRETAASSRRLTGPLGRHAFDDFATGRFTKKEILVRSLSEPAAKLIPDSQALQQASARHGPALSRRRRRR
jgi:Putative neutral zinc metallopeptidase